MVVVWVWEKRGKGLRWWQEWEKRGKNDAIILLWNYRNDPTHQLSFGNRIARVEVLFCANVAEFQAIHSSIIVVIYIRFFSLHKSSLLKKTWKPVISMKLFILSSSKWKKTVLYKMLFTTISLGIDFALKKILIYANKHK